MKFTFSWPDSRLMPNYKRANHWRKYVDAAKRSRMSGWAVVYDALGRDLSAARKSLHGDTPIAVRITLTPPDRRRRDADGMIAACKHLQDGMCDALNINDHRLRPSYEFAEPEKPGRVEVEILG